MCLFTSPPCTANVLPSPALSGTCARGGHLLQQCVSEQKAGKKWQKLPIFLCFLMLGSLRRRREDGITFLETIGHERFVSGYLFSPFCFCIVCSVEVATSICKCQFLIWKSEGGILGLIGTKLMG